MVSFSVPERETGIPVRLEGQEGRVGPSESRFLRPEEQGTNTVLSGTESGKVDEKGRGGRNSKECAAEKSLRKRLGDKISRGGGVHTT